MTDHLVYPKHSPIGKNTRNSRSGRTIKTIKGKNGYLVMSFDTSDLACRILCVLINDVQQLSEHARNKVTENLSEQVVAGKYTQLYKQVI